MQAKTFRSYRVGSSSCAHVILQVISERVSFITRFVSEYCANDNKLRDTLNC